MLLCRNRRQYKRVGGCENAEQRNKDIKYRGRSVQVAWKEKKNEGEDKRRGCRRRGMRARISGGIGRRRGMRARLTAGLEGRREWNEDDRRGWNMKGNEGEDEQRIRAITCGNKSECAGGTRTPQVCKNATCDGRVGG